MTLRGRLTTAFLAVVLGPVLLGAIFVGGTVAAVSRDRSLDRLDVAATTVQSSVGGLCRQLQSAADAIAVLPPGSRGPAAEQIIARDLASAVHVTDRTGAPAFETAGLVTPPWNDCAGAGAPSAGPATTGPASRGHAPAGQVTAGAVPAGRPQALAARAELRGPGGHGLGAVQVARLLDDRFLERLAGAAGVAVTLLAPGDSGDQATHSAGPTRAGPTPAGPTRGDTRAGDAVVSLAERLSNGQVARTDEGVYVRRVGPATGQPLPLAVSVPGADLGGLFAVLVSGVVLAGLLAVLTAWLLARSTTRPLVELAGAADRVADGHLDVRVPVRCHDELGRLAGAFNRMTREMQAYVQALTASRDQLRGHVGILGDTLSSTHDLHRILQVLLRTALAATSARAGLVLLTDPAAGVLVGQCAEGLAERWQPVDSERRAGAGAAPGIGAVAHLRLPLSEGLLGGVGATGVSRRGRVTPDGAPLSADEPRCRTFVAVPICAPAPAGGDPIASGPVLGRGSPGRLAGSAASTVPTTLGVLALYDRLGPDGFDEADLRSLRTFAGQAGVAIDNVRMHEEAQRLSLTDPLTGLWNYRYLMDSIRREVERASRFGRMLTVLALDLDHFKKVNDRYGHAAGDAVLVEFARRIRGEVREVDLAFRHGGEEFVVLLPETDARGGVIVAERLGAAIRDRPVAVPAARSGDGTDGRAVAITVSIGVGVFPDHAANAAGVLAAADAALYAAKAAGRDTYRVAVSTDHRAGQEVAVAGGGPGAGGAPGGPQPPRQSRCR